MDSSGFSSPRPECFPAGLRVLVVDDDPTWLKILEKMLKKCNYEVTTCNLARDALNLLRERKDGFDIVISDVNMPDMDGFRLLEHVGLEMDLPVIMMSVDGETSRVMKGVQHGACDYLLKPIRMKELRNIWQHVFRKRIHEVRDIEGHESYEEIQMLRCGGELSDDGFLFCGDLASGKKRKDVDGKYDDRVSGDSSSAKKARVVWTVDLHQKFVKAVNQIGFEKVGPKKILDLMGVPWLTRENVASHLQKYRLYLSRLQKENELKATFGGTKYCDPTSRDLAGNVCLQNPIVKNATTSQSSILADENFAVPGHKIPVHYDEPKTCGGNVKEILPKRGAQLGDVTDPVNISYDHSFGDSDVKSEPKNQVQYSWRAGVAPPQFKNEQNPSLHSEHRFDTLPMSIHHIQVSSAETSLAPNPGTSTKESDKPRFRTSKHIDKVTKVASTDALFSVPPDPNPNSVWNIKNNSLDQNLFDDLGSTQRNSIVGNGSALRLWDEQVLDHSSQVDFHPPNAYVDPLGFSNQDLIADVPPHLYDLLRFDPEFPSDLVEYPAIDQGVFTV
ncbi:hypothetical protein ACS0TY_009184 [Phlomoides rotata]